MEKIIIFITLLSFNVWSQNDNKQVIYVLIDSEKYNQLYEFHKTNTSARLKVLYFNQRKESFKNANKSGSTNEVIKVSPQPNINYYEFNSFGTTEEINSIAELNHYSIEDVSKNNKNVWKKYPYVIIFIEKLAFSKYKLWKMKPVINE